MAAPAAPCGRSGGVLSAPSEAELYLSRQVTRSGFVFEQRIDSVIPDASVPQALLTALSMLASLVPEAAVRQTDWFMKVMQTSHSCCAIVMLK